MNPIIWFLIAHWYLSLLMQTFFHHRYAAHAQFTMSKTWEKIFFFLSFIFQGSSYLSPYVYGILHRLHHAYADQKGDPHSPRHDGNPLKMMWNTLKVYNEIANGKKEVEGRFKRKLPEWPALDRIAMNWWTNLAWGFLYAVFYWFFAPSWWYFLLLPVHFLMSPIHGTIINWFAHTWGYRNFILPNKSRNLLPVDVLMLGEGYHNNHHASPERSNFGRKWFEFDLTYHFIMILESLGVIRLA